MSLDELNEASDGPEPYGAQVARRLHEDASILMKDYDEMMGLLDHEGLKGHLQKTLEGIENNMTTLEDMFSESYPHLKALGDEDDENFETKEIDDMDDEFVGKDIDEDMPMDDDLPDDDIPMEDDGTLEGLDEGDDEGIDSDVAIPADSLDEDADIPDPDEVVEGMATKRLKTRKKNLKSKKKSMNVKGKYLIAYRQKGVKSWKKKSFEDESDREEFAEKLLKAFDEDEVDIMTKDMDEDESGYSSKGLFITKDEIASLPETAFSSRNALKQAVFNKFSSGISDETADRILKDHKEGKIKQKTMDDNEDDITPAMKRLIKSAADFLDEVAEDGKSFDDEERMKAYHHYKNFEDVTGDDEEMESKAMPGTPEWEKEEMQESEHKSKGWHKDMEEEEESESMKMCKDCMKFLKSLSREKAFGDNHREKAAYFKNALDAMSEDEEGIKSLKSRRKGIEDAQDETDDEQNDYISNQINKKDYSDDEDGMEVKGMDEDDIELDEETIKMLSKTLKQQHHTINVLAKNINGMGVI